MSAIEAYSAMTIALCMVVTSVAQAISAVIGVWKKIRNKSAQPQPYSAVRNPSLGFWWKNIIFVISLAMLLVMLVLPPRQLNSQSVALLLLAQLNAIMAFMNLRA